GCCSRPPCIANNPDIC
uniref:Alpha-conotoxin Tx1C n=1 Tax=Conus textile TaxID=6494 RepID=CA1C_CONTE|nr:RecName: Full=Alpha-conotoxin Tx1C; AltName: Full=Alpha-conotoxin-like 1 [Conus textile]